MLPVLQTGAQHRAKTAMSSDDKSKSDLRIKKTSDDTLRATAHYVNTYSVTPLTDVPGLSDVPGSKEAPGSKEVPGSKLAPGSKDVPGS